MQSKLLRLLQQREVQPVGSTERRRIDVRIIAAPNRDLEGGIKTGTFRQDLYFRPSVVQVTLPALREVKSDIPLLVTSFLDKFCDPQRATRMISEDAMRRLIAYDWPGNVRENELLPLEELDVASRRAHLRYRRDDAVPQAQAKSQGAGRVVGLATTFRRRPRLSRLPLPRALPTSRRRYIRTPESTSARADAF